MLYWSCKGFTGVWNGYQKKYWTQGLILCPVKRRCHIDLISIMHQRCFLPALTPLLVFKCCWMWKATDVECFFPDRRQEVQSLCTSLQQRNGVFSSVFLPLTPKRADGEQRKTGQCLEQKGFFFPCLWSVVCEREICPLVVTFFSFFFFLL